MTIVCVDDHPIMLKGLLENIRQVFLDASIFGFERGDEALEFVKENPAQVSAFLDEFKASTEFINANVEEGAVLVENLGIVKAAVATKAIPNCNIKFFEGAEMKTVVSGYLQTLYDQNPKAVGGTMPADDFYYAR